MEKPFSEKCKMLSQFLQNATMFTDALLEGRQKAILTKANEILTPEDIPPPSPDTLTPSSYTSASGVTGLLPQARSEPSGEPLIEGVHKGGASDSNKQKQEATKIKAQLALPWSQYKLDKMEVLLEKITKAQLDPTRSAILQNIQYSSNLLSEKWDEVAATILRELRTETTSTQGEPYENRLLRAIVETWVAQDYNKILENDAKELNINLADIGPLQLYQPPAPTSMGQKARTLGHGALSLGRRATHKMSKMASWASRLAHKHLQSSEDCPTCEPGGYSKAYIKQAIAKCQEEKACVGSAKDTKIVDVMIRPSSFKPFYSVAVYENPPGQSASQVVAEAAAAAAPGFHGPVQSKQSTSTHSKTTGRSGRAAAAAQQPETTTGRSGTTTGRSGTTTGRSGTTTGRSGTTTGRSGTTTGRSGTTTGQSGPAGSAGKKPSEPAHPPPSSSLLEAKMITQLQKLEAVERQALPSALPRAQVMGVTPGGGVKL